MKRGVLNGCVMLIRKLLAPASLRTSQSRGGSAARGGVLRALRCRLVHASEMVAGSALVVGALLWRQGIAHHPTMR
eukprot:scaffold27027_cov72-Phaeocystis_antarctica.AAC.2